jgi:hypothetical protein
MKVFLGIIVGIVIVVVIGVLVLGYLGFVPGLSKLMGANKPAKLGTTFTAADYNSAISKSGIQMNDNLANTYVPKSQKVYGPPKAVSMDLTPAEILAVLNSKPMSPGIPFKDYDLRINPDNSVEVSSLLEVDIIANSNQVPQEVKDALKSVNEAGLKEVPVYLKGEVSVVNGQLNYDAQDIKIGKISIPSQQVDDNKSQITGYFQTVQSYVPGLSIKNASIVNGKLHFDGTVPSSVSAK